MRCPKCGGTTITKEYLFGMDTGDKICCDCNHVFSKASGWAAADAAKKAMVPAPKCSACDRQMEAHDSTRWRCVCPSCAEAGKPIHTGIYPFFKVEADPTLPPGTVELRGAGGEVQVRLINVGTDDKSFTCPKCGRVTCNPHDIENGYCGACHDFTGPMR
jgi:predicted RNA-binding Zn-ribbon protein involved in translation (DUF1610 family)